MDTHKTPDLETTRRRRRRATSVLQDFHEIKNLQGTSSDTKPPAAVVEESGRERLKRHRLEMSGRVWIPDIWGQEDLLKKWIDCTVFDSAVDKSSVMSAKEALIQEGRSTLTLRIENSC